MGRLQWKDLVVVAVLSGLGDLHGNGRSGCDGLREGVIGCRRLATETRNMQLCACGRGTERQDAGGFVVKIGDGGRFVDSRWRRVLLAGEGTCA